VWPLRKTISLDYPIEPRPRYGWGRPEHSGLAALLGWGFGQYRDQLKAFLDFAPLLCRIPKQRSDRDPVTPYWLNSALPGLDAVALYGFIASRRPRLYVAVGVGHSTCFARRAIADHGSRTRILGIDIAPDAGADEVCDELIVSPLEDLAPEIFDQLQAGDILFVDNSHRALMNSDVTVVFLDILPRLRPGVIVQLHDIALPFDYPPEWTDRFYSEQYVLGAALLAGATRFQVLLPNAYVSMRSQLSSILAPLWSRAELNGYQSTSRLDSQPITSISQLRRNDAPDLIPEHGSSFWMVMRDEPLIAPSSP
jgi:hypothetical protein